MKAKHTPATGEYLIRIHTLRREGQRVVWARLAERMGVSPPAVSQALRRMARSGLVVLDPDREVELTPQGRQEAEAILRRHYLIERLLVDELGFDWADADEEAEKMEQSLSPRLEEHLYERLGRPTTCPHGNPFPGSPDEERLLHARRLTDVAPNERVTLLRVTEEGEDEPDLLHVFNAHGLLPGAEVILTRLDNTSDQLDLMKQGRKVTIPARWARYVRVTGPSSL